MNPYLLLISHKLLLVDPRFSTLFISSSQTMIARIQLTASLFLTFFITVLVFASALAQDPLSCSQVASSTLDYPPCINNKGEQDQCATFAVLRTNSYYSSLSNFSSYLGITPSAISLANGFPAGGADFLGGNQLLLIPINCRCGGSGFFEADLTKTTAKGESFYTIAQSLEGLASCRAIQDKNPGFTFLGEKQVLQIPVKCACPSYLEISEKTQILLSYPVSKGDTVVNLAVRFNATPEKIVSVNSNRSSEFKPENLLPFTTVLIPAEAKPKLDLRKPGKKTRKMRKKKVYIAIGVIALVATISITAAFFFLQWRKKNHHHHPLMNRKMGADSELQQLGLSVRTTSEKKISFEGSTEESLHRQQSNETVSTTISAAGAKKKTTLVEIYSMDELRKATEDFSSTNLIEDSVYQGRLNGKELAIKKTSSDTVSRIEFVLFQDAIHRHPNILRLLGTTFSGVIDHQSPDSYLVFEYAKNGSLKDWLHGGLAMKSQFIASCNCFLTWKQRLRICLDIASALQFMHQVMNPPYIHKNIKSRNVFLDEEFNARIGNFGMAECQDEKQSSEISPSHDVFAFGVILMEVLTGKPPASGGGGGQIKRILKSENADDRLREWMDEALGEKYRFDAAVAVADLAEACVEEEAGLRPSAGEIVDRLTRLVEEDAVVEAEERGFVTVCESSSKPLVQVPAASCSETGGGNS